MTHPHPDQPATPGPFRLGYVPGATPAKWVRTWRMRSPVPLDLIPLAADAALSAILAGQCDIAIVRPPVDGDRLRSIALYDERTVVIVPRDHLLAALDETEEPGLADVAGDVVLWPSDDVVDWPDGLPGVLAADRPATTKDAIELVAAGIGVVIVPQSLARLHQRKDVTYRLLADGPVAPVRLAWDAEAEGDLTQEFIGIVRGRTARSSRGVATSGSPAVRSKKAPQSGAGRGGAGAGRKTTGRARRKPRRD